jgi:response regulator RpfG family c-di-GMP phosphodiesterase
MTEKILFVDDDQNILASYQRVFRKVFELRTAQGGEEALKAIATNGPYAVIVSDMQMPTMNGVTFLTKARKVSPDSVRMILTGYADVQTAIEAVNEGHVFRFLTKPCHPETLAAALTAGIAQYRLVTAEKELIEKTLSGAVKVLTDVLSIVSPTAFGRASRVQRLAHNLARTLKAENAWQLEIAAMLSLLGCVTLPEETLDKVVRGNALSSLETKLLREHPKIGRDLIANIPRLEQVAAIIGYQEQHFDGSGVPGDGVRGAALPLGARILKVALDFDTLVAGGASSEEALRRLRERTGWYDPAVVEALQRSLDTERGEEIRSVSVHELTTDMVFAEEIRSTSDLLLIAKGQQVTSSLRLRLLNIASHGGLMGPVRVVIPAGASADAPGGHRTALARTGDTRRS